MRKKYMVFHCFFFLLCLFSLLTMQLKNKKRKNETKKKKHKERNEEKNEQFLEELKKIFFLKKFAHRGIKSTFFCQLFFLLLCNFFFWLYFLRIMNDKGHLKAFIDMYTYCFQSASLNVSHWVL